MFSIWVVRREFHGTFFSRVNVLMTFYMGTCLKESFEKKKIKGI